MSARWPVVSGRLHFAHPANCAEDSTPKQHRDRCATHVTYPYALVGACFPDHGTGQVFLAAAQGSVDRCGRPVGIGGGCGDRAGTADSKASCPNASGRPGVVGSRPGLPHRGRSVMASSGTMFPITRGQGPARTDRQRSTFPRSTRPSQPCPTAAPSVCDTTSVRRPRQTRKIGRGLTRTE